MHFKLPTRVGSYVIRVHFLPVNLVKETIACYYVNGIIISRLRLCSWYHLLIIRVH